MHTLRPSPPRWRGALLSLERRGIHLASAPSARLPLATVLTRPTLEVGDEQQRTGDLAEVINVARAAVEQEFQVSERLDAKARGQVTLAGQWFAVAQAVSAVAFAVKGVEGWLLYAVGATALVGGALLVIMFVQTSKVWRVREEDAVHPRGILQLKERALNDDAGALEVTVQHYARILQGRRRTNKLRADALEKAEKIWLLAMAAPLLQLGFAIAARLFA